MHTLLVGRQAFSHAQHVERLLNNAVYTIKGVKGFCVKHPKEIVHRLLHGAYYAGYLLKMWRISAAQTFLQYILVVVGMHFLANNLHQVVHRHRIRRSWFTAGCRLIIKIRISVVHIFKLLHEDGIELLHIVVKHFLKLIHLGKVRTFLQVHQFVDVLEFSILS